MGLKLRAIEEFKEIWLKQFGQELLDSEAEEYASEILKIFSIIIKND